MTMLYGNLADAALGDLRFGGDAQQRLKTSLASPAARLLAGVLLGAVALASLVILSDAPAHVADALPSLDDLERWLVWGDSRPL